MIISQIQHLVKYKHGYKLKYSTVKEASQLLKLSLCCSGFEPASSLSQKPTTYPDIFVGGGVTFGVHLSSQSGLYNYHGGFQGQKFGELIQIPSFFGR